MKRKSIQHQYQTGREVLARASEKSSGPLELGQLRVIIFNEKIIDKGMQEILETLNRNPSVGNAIYLAITNVKGESLLKGIILKKRNCFLSILFTEQNMDNGTQPKQIFYVFKPT